MNKEIMKRWVKALKSGKYKKGKGYLCQIVGKTGNKSFCCLGVLSELYKQDMKRKKKKDCSRLEENYVDAKDGVIPYWNVEGVDAGTLPEAVAKWAGIDTSNANWDLGFIKNQKHLLADLNDGGKSSSDKALSFKRIADLIEENYKDM
jgi:hypothetical protein